MGKKFLGILFFVAALLILAVSIVNGSLFSDKGSVAETYGNFFGTLIPVVFYALSGIFLFKFDNPTKINYIDGFKKRRKQATVVIVLFVVSAVLYFVMSLGLGIVVSAKTGLTDLGPIGLILVNILYNPFLYSLIVFLELFFAYVRPYLVCKKVFCKKR